MKATILAFLAACALPLAAAQRPNFIMVFIDDMGWADFSCFGNKEAQTPNIDRLAAEGIRFEQFYVNSSICSPSRCALTTGQYPQRWKITSFLNNRADNERRGMAQWLDPAAPTLARFLQDGGYATGHFGKWHLGGQRDVAEAPPITRYGFDTSLTNFEGMGAKLLPLAIAPGDAKPHRIWADAVRLGEPVTWMKRSEITTGFIDAALPFIDKAVADKKPFYVNLWPDDVHSPFWPPVDKWANGKRGLYLSVLREMDLQFGKLFDHVRNSPELRDNTVILICSDNGPEPGAGSAGKLRGHKGSLYEGGIRSPLIVWAPRLIADGSAGSTNDTSVMAAFDLPPSLLKMAGITAPAGVKFDGEDHSAALLGKEATVRTSPVFWRRPPDRKLVGEPAKRQPDLAVRDGNWKLLCNYNGSRPQLFDLAADAPESKDVAAGHPEVVKRLAAAVTAWHRSMPADKGPQLGKPKDKAKRGG
ncbi:sulfatase-like hydrolase/transferase [Luteolibacter marinus]|uniref:sulfatase-like hydrolase/transferase n=1 Tax=Luteolibacter marinus TaxID=2776705 RepID=UPI001867F238|nr:sulfatase-like hydrolase/transferase [Luteolibacter marinus]